MARIFRDYREAASVNSLLALWGFVDDTTFLTKSGHVGVVYRVRGVDYEGLSHAQRQALAHRFGAALRLLDERCRVYEYLVKRPINPVIAAPCAQPIVHEAVQARAAYLNGRRDHLYDLGLYLVVMYEGGDTGRTSTRLRNLWRAPTKAFHDWLSSSHTCALLESELGQS